MKTAIAVAAESSDGYPEFENAIANRIKAHSGPLFTTDATPEALWDAYLKNLSPGRRQHYNCHECRRFIGAFGGLVSINANGDRKSLLWDLGPVPSAFAKSVRALKKLVASSKMTGVFLAAKKAAGTAKTGSWTHFHGQFRDVFSSLTKTADQAMAEKREEHKMLCAALADYSKSTVEAALRVLKADALTRSEKALGMAEWFAKLQDANSGQLWLAVATAPVGYCHVRSSMIGTLLDDIKAGFDFNTISKRWSEKMNPLQYQRPTAAPKVGNILQAEKLVDQMGIRKSLERRYATLDDVESKLWEPRTVRPSRALAGGVFSDLLPKASLPNLTLPPKNITWEKFARDVLPDARNIEVRLPTRGSYYGLVTAVHADAPNILQWDNPVSWYVYTNGSSPYQWGLTGVWGKVTAVFLPPHQWTNPGKIKNHAREAFFALEGARDGSSSVVGLCLFPEILKSELHPIRSVIEAYSGRGTIQGFGGNANGIVVSDNNGNGKGALTVRVDGNVYNIDRWE